MPCGFELRVQACQLIDYVHFHRLIEMWSISVCTTQKAITKCKEKTTHTHKHTHAALNRFRLPLCARGEETIVSNWTVFLFNSMMKRRTGRSAERENTRSNEKREKKSFSVWCVRTHTTQSESKLVRVIIIICSNYGQWHSTALIWSSLRSFRNSERSQPVHVCACVCVSVSVAQLIWCL